MSTGDTTPPVVLLTVTIPTHVRTILGVARLLSETGRWTPQIVYFPHNVYTDNVHDCAKAPYISHVWCNGRFTRHDAAREDVPSTIEGDAQMLARGGPSAAASPVAVRPVSPRRQAYQRLRRLLPFLPPPDMIVKAIVWGYQAFYDVASPVARRMAVLLALARFVPVWWGERLRAPEPDHAPGGRLRSFFLALFEHEWRRCMASAVAGSTTASRITFYRGLATQAQFHAAFGRLVDAEHARLVVEPEDNLFYSSHLIMHAAHERGIPTVVVPFTIANALEWAEAFHGDVAYHAGRGMNRLLSRAFPHWVMNHRGRSLVLPATHVVACEYFGVTPDQPWVINSGRVDAIACESPFMRQYYIDAGIAPERVVTTGTLADDSLFALLNGRDHFRAALGDRLGVRLGERIALMGLPPDQFKGPRRQGVEFADYVSLVRHMVATVTASRAWTVLINLHPRVRREDVAFLESLGATIVDEPIEMLIPLADIYISVVSATIRLAVTCGIPVINYDAYQYDYSDYKALRGVTEIKLRADFDAAVRAHLDDPAVLATARALQAETAGQQGVLDGRAGERILALVDRVAGSSETSELATATT